MLTEMKVDIGELNKLFIACPKCGAEIGFDLTKEERTIKDDVRCPDCSEILDELIPAELQPKPKLTTWVRSFKELFKARGKRCVFFRISASAQPPESELASGPHQR